MPRVDDQSHSSQRATLVEGLERPVPVKPSVLFDVPVAVISLLVAERSATSVQLTPSYTSLEA